MANLDSTSGATNCATAIVGISVEFPGGPMVSENLGYADFFEFLLNQGEAYETIPAERFDINAWHGTSTGDVITKTGTFLKSISLFDHLEFGITSRDVASMSVSTRKLIEHSFLALLDSGVDYRGRNVGCYMASTMDTSFTADPNNIEAAGSFAGYPYMTANKVSYHLDLRGPSIPTTTACSSTASALYLAVQALRLRDCESAVIGGCQLNYRVEDWIQYSDGKVLSVDGRCKPLDASADGFSRGEGVAVLVVKRLDDAIQDGDHIYASILGIGVSSTGSAGPVSAPVADTQTEAMRRAFAGTGRHPSEVDFVELHATGTAAGDPAEANWVSKNFVRDDILPVGSVKGNIGHLEVPSFFAAVSKVCSMFQTELIPPTVGIRTLNPAIDWTNINVPTRVSPLRARNPSGRSLVAINTSGIGGANAHAVLEGPPPFGDPSKGGRLGGPVLFVTGGLSPRSASSNADALAQMVLKNTDLARQISTTYGRRSRQMTWRSYAVFELEAGALTFSPPVLCPRHSNRSPVVFVFSGQGPQHIDMGRELFKAYPTFRESVLRMDAIYKEVVGQSLILQTGLFSGSKKNFQREGGLWPITITLPSLAILQMALVDLLQSVGIVPDAVFGHSAGESSMLYSAGAASQEMALKLAIARGQALSLAEGVDGCMAAMSCSSAQAERFIQTAKHDLHAASILEIACFNGPDAVTISGHTSLVERTVNIARAEGVFATKLRTSVPVHSTLMEVCRDKFKDLVSPLFDTYPTAAASLPVYSTVTGVQQNEPFTSEYFWKNTRQPVLFSSTAALVMREHPDAIYIEIGPHPVLATYLENPRAKAVLCPLVRPRYSDPKTPSEPYTFLDCLGRLAVLGCKHASVDFRQLNMHSRSPNNIPTIPYPFQRKHIPYYRGPSTFSTLENSARKTRRGPLGQSDMNISALTHPSLVDHVIHGEPIMPAAGYIEMALASGGRILWNVSFEAIMPLSKNTRPVKFQFEDCQWTVSSVVISSKDSVTQSHAMGYMSKAGMPRPPDLDINAFQLRSEKSDVNNFYETMAYFAQYGPMYRRVTAYWKNKQESLIQVMGADEQMISDGYVLHPAILDSCIHSAVHHLFTGNMDPTSYFLPSKVDVVTLYDIPAPESLQKPLYAHIVRQKWSPDAITFNVSIVDNAGQHILELSGLRVERHYLSPIKPPSRCFDMIHQPYGLPMLSTYRDDDEAHTSESTSFPEAHIDDIDQIEDAIDDTVKRLRRVVDTLTHSSSTRILRVLDLTTAGKSSHTALSSQVLRLMNERQIFCDYSITSTKGQTSPNDNDNSSCHTVEFDWNTTAKHQYIPRHIYDVIIGISSEMRSSHIAALHDLLVPGGMVIVIIPNQMKGMLPGEQDLWRASMGKHFRSSSVIACRRYFIIEAQKPTLHLPEIWVSDYEKQGFPMLSFRLGGELGMRNEILQSQSSNTAVIWIESTMDVSGAAARGFCRSLRREIVGTNVRLALFNETWSTRERSGYLRWLSGVDGLENELEFLVERNGQLLLPRLVPSPSFEASQAPSIDSLRYWTATTTGQVAASPCPRVPPNHVLLSISLMSEPNGNVRGLYGKIVDAGDTQWCIHSYVTAIVCGPLSNFAIVHTGQILAPRWKDQLGALVPTFIASSFLGFGSLKSCRRFQNRRAVLLLGNDDRSGLSERLTQVLEFFGISTIIAVDGAPQLLGLIKPGDLVLSSYNEDRKSTRSICDFVGASLYLWDDPVNGILEEVGRNPWKVSDTFDVLRDTNFPPSVLLGSSQTPSDLVAAHAIKPCLFCEDVFYLLHGGIGSLGLQIALWMYQKGARKIVLTSRTGGVALSRKNPAAFNLLTYLSEIQDLELHLECCDASSVSDMQRLTSKLPGRIGGCILLSVILEDRSYANHTLETYNRVFPAKTEAFTVLEKTLAIEQLEFLVTVSSAAIFGSAGQTNYSSANTAVDFMIRRYPNAFALVAPAIIDSDTVIDPDTLLPRPSLKQWAPWAMTSQHLCACLEDGLARMRNQSFWLYIPDYSWSEFQRFCGPSPLYDHLIPMQSKTVMESQGEQGVLPQIEQLVCDSLGLSIEELSSDVPLTAYGLDSLSASRLSVSLRHFLSITQLQLLGDISLHDILALIRRTSNPLKDDRKLFDWRKLNLPGETVVKLVDSEGIPLVIIHGASGNVLAFKGMQEIFDTPLYACQFTPDTPVSSLQSMAQFYFQQIKSAIPNGPYRLAGYCGTCLLTLEIARNFESNGDEIIQLAFLDYSPALYTSTILWDFDAQSLQNKVASIPLVNKLLDVMLTLYENSTSKLHLDIAKDLRKVAAGHVERELMMSYYQIFGDICRTITPFLIELGETDGVFSYRTLQVELTKLVRSIKACSMMTVFVASRGMVQSFDEPHEWKEDLGCRSIVPEAQVVVVESDHMSILNHAMVADRLQQEWRNV
ncbi:hypothetical protein EV421DRAFT_720319 [Armillaria borealis]|uniref:Polyketide synthase n=1 Tax=Armillaria borealis TaxID=47425 RepID=A0AA39K655_9AGAR|nr:hypothetical protein EV421DRAFT_720319 [Armillaria borealis]